MATTSTSPLSSAGTQQLYNQGLLPTSLPNSVYNNSSSSQVSKLAVDSVALQQVDSLLGISTTDQTNAVSNTTGTDPLTQAVSNALTSSVNAAVQKFLPQDSNTNGSQINLLA